MHIWSSSCLPLWFMPSLIHNVHRHVGSYSFAISACLSLWWSLLYVSISINSLDAWKTQCVLLWYAAIPLIHFDLIQLHAYHACGIYLIVQAYSIDASWFETSSCPLPWLDNACLFHWCVLIWYIFMPTMYAALARSSMLIFIIHSDLIHLHAYYTSCFDLEFFSLYILPYFPSYILILYSFMPIIHAFWLGISPCIFCHILLCSSLHLFVSLSHYPTVSPHTYFTMTFVVCLLIGIGLWS